ncbi:MAG: DUF2235 domain-containing protein [Fibrobacterota bacterium]|nr:DUF2235 domain-containing protein [Fibrobacterota bacterium]QQS06982.1 MAG: DUF2235 domain-containing protein [Fibrobacterota bacterium]
MNDKNPTKKEFREKLKRPCPTYIVKPGDSFESLAERFYRNSVFAPAISVFNDIQDSYATLEIGKELRLPTTVFVHRKGEAAYSADFAPEGPIQIGLFFDGTNNSMLHDYNSGPNKTSSESNVAKLFYLYPLEEGKIFKAYIRGVGTDGGGTDGKDNSLKSTGGAGFGWHFEAKIALAMLYLKERVKTNTYTKYVIDVFGFSRGAAEARHFLTCLWRPEFQDVLGVFADHIEVRFVGIFDTVESVGTGPVGFDAGRALALQPQMATRVVHLIAQTEVRINFDLRSLRLPPGATSTKVGATEKAWRSLSGASYEDLAKSPPLPPGWEERIFPGVHSDVGGGYSEGFYRPSFPTLKPLEGESAVNYHRRVADLELERGGQPHPPIMSGPPEEKGIQEQRVFERCQVHSNEYQARMSELLSADPPTHLVDGLIDSLQDPQKVKEKRDQKWELWKPCSNYMNFNECPKLKNPSNAGQSACPVLERKWTLSLLPLQYMIQQAMKAGVPLASPSEANEKIRTRTEIPPDSDLQTFGDIMNDQSAFEKAIQPSNEAYQTKLVPLMHDSRWLVDDYAFREKGKAEGAAAALMTSMAPVTKPLVIAAEWTSPYRREVYYNISMEDGYRYTMPDVLPDSPVEIPDWAKPVLHNFVRNLKGNVLPVHQFAARYTGLIPPTNPEEFNWELSENDEIVERFNPEQEIEEAEIWSPQNHGTPISPEHHLTKTRRKKNNE